ncbi:L-threonylcarbamoyladenylate synthase [Noviherbaspirillum denitrificans]|uniref:Threonylcarbamoyl-AMP synthase n=1 Tax=Noviherbaspirillum denitrificans TaxID=1968433 RepID=A0A254TPM5_9BURK|nr:L-threonylcarbamoyladenylate synthase [Noviherbaspirillum denitrificans]OWW22593.1 translation factor Sua5 [Noviherbaspirillum denitrificans]
MSQQPLDMPAIKAAARKLEQGELVALPTETVYGLGADAENPQAVAKIYEAKGRPSNHPVIVHLAPGADVGYWATDIPAEAYKLIDAFWPGPLTLILKRAPHIPDAVSGGQDSVGLRCPSHPVAQALLREFKGGKGGVAAPSANRFGHVSPTTAQHVRDEFGTGAGSPLACILEGGQSEVGIESTIVDLSRMATHGPVLLRPGHISAAQIEQAIGMLPCAPDAAAPRASGTLEAHYAPRTPVALVQPAELANTIDRLTAVGRSFALIRRTHAADASALEQQLMPVDPEGYAYGLYAALRAMDGASADVILVEALPAEDAWQGINDRLRRAAHDSQGILSRLLA